MLSSIGSTIPPVLSGFLMVAGVLLTACYLINCWGLHVAKAKRHKETPCQPTDVHADVQRHVQPWINRLKGLKFEGPGIFTIESLSGFERMIWRLTHAESKSVAELSVMIPPNGGEPFITLGFVTFLSNDRVLATLEPGTCDHRPTHWLLHSGRFKTIGAQWDKHRSRLDELAPHITSVTPAHLIQALADERAAMIQASIEAGMLRPHAQDADTVVFNRILIPWFALKMLKCRIPGSGIRTRRRSDVLPPDPIAPSSVGFQPANPEELIERDLKKYRETTGAGKGLGKLAKLALLAVSLGVFAWLWEGGNTGGMTAVVVGVLLLHEFGHWLPMKLFGYQNVTMFFLPGFGAAVSGRKRHAPAWQEFIVLAGGPIPGLLAGIAVMVYGYFNRDIPDLWLNAAGIAIALNAFNLLPVLPLDGGRILDLLVFRDIPLLRLLFTIFSTLCVIGASFLPGMGFLRYVAIGMGTGIFHDIKLLRIRKEAGKVEWAGQYTDEDTALRKLFGEIRASGNSNFVGGQDWLLKTQAVVDEVLRKRPGWLMRCAGIGSYAAFCLVPLLLVIALIAISAGGWFTKSFGVFDCMTEFQPPARESEQTLTAEQSAPIERLLVSTEDLLNHADSGSSGLPQVDKSADSFPASACRDLDYLRWEHVGIAQQTGMVNSSLVDVWLETACRRMESALTAGKNLEAVRRSEILLHAIHSLEPAATHAQRQLLWDTQIRTLKTIAALHAKGMIPSATQAAMKRRVQALDKKTAPADEAFLLADGWTQMELKRIAEIEGDEVTHAKTSSDDSGFFRSVYDQFDDLVNFEDRKLPASVAVARLWNTGNHPGELPAKLSGDFTIEAGEADFLFDYCDRRRETAWLRAAIVAAIDLDLYQQQRGALPSQWSASLPGGGSLELASGPKPSLRLVDRRSETQRSGPDWLTRKASGPQPTAECPLPPTAQKPAPPANPIVSSPKPAPPIKN